MRTHFRNLVLVLVSMPALGLAGQAGAVFQQDAGVDGIVYMEAEKFDQNVPGSGAYVGQQWQVDTTHPGFTGTSAMQALPDSGNPNVPLADADANSPKLGFQINFVKTGTHYIYIRTLDLGGNADSIHAGLDGTATVERMDFSGAGTAYTWDSTINAGGPATVNVATAGAHTFWVYMREDGAVLDKVILSTNAALSPDTVADPGSGGEGEGEGEPVEQGNTILSNVYPPFIDEGTTVILTGPVGTAHQWKKDGVDIVGATERELVFDSVTLLDEGVYTVDYNDGTSVVPSDPFTLSVSPEGTVPLAGLAGLAALLGAVSVGGASYLHRRK